MDGEYERLLRLYRERVAGYTGVTADFGDRWSQWCRRLLAHGGDLVVPPLRPEPDLDLFLSAAVLGGPRVSVVGDGGDCHANVARLWIEGAIDFVCTGYALSGDLWRQHSWGADGDGTVLETKHLSERYFGLALAEGEQTVRFALSNYDGDVGQVLRQGNGRASEIVRVLQAVRARARS